MIKKTLLGGTKLPMALTSKVRRGRKKQDTEEGGREETKQLCRFLM
jgi:hypothetical protein